MPDFPTRPLGAIPKDDGVQFRVWAPKAESINLALHDPAQLLPMNDAGYGYFERFVEGAAPGARYRYGLDNAHRFPDPASRFQPDGVHNASVVVDPTQYSWSDSDWAGLARDERVVYELHVGTFTEAGTFAGVQDKLDHLADLGVTAIELMPVADFPGRWNWGYDPAAFYAPSRAYGSPDDLRALVDAAHQAGLAVFLDVIYNHLGPDGAYVAAFAPMFTDKHETPWGQAINLDDEHSAGVRHFFIHNALHWLHEYHLDGLRLDATHALHDESTPHFLAALHDAVHQLDGPRRHLIAEDPRNPNHFLQPRAKGGYGLDGIWADDFHHQVRHLTAGDSEGYYASYDGHTTEELATTVRDGWYYRGQTFPSTGEPWGTDPGGIDLDQCVICIQNHDQVGNRPTGRRLTDGVAPAAYRAATALLLFAPETPLLFMGQEWAASAPFQFFTDHYAELGEQVRAGRKREFEDFSGFQGTAPDPQAEATFRRSKLDWDEAARGDHAKTLALYRDLLALRPALPDLTDATAHGDHGLHVQRGDYHLLVAFAEDQSMPCPPDAELHLHTEAETYTSGGQPPKVDGSTLHFPRAGAAVLMAS